MNAFDRRSEIIRHVQNRQRVSTIELSDRFGVSEVTIRNDLRVLAGQGWIQRVHGGAELSPDFLQEQSFATRATIHSYEKESIALAAAALVRSGDTLLLDSSTTAYQLALELAKTRTTARVVTNNLHIAMTLKDSPQLEVIILGGVIRGETASVVGQLASDMLGHLHVDKAFLSASGLSLERGLTDADIREVEVKRAMVGAAQQVIAMLDASKLGKQSFLTFARLEDIDHLLCEQDISTDFRTVLQSLGIHIHIIST
ncbi:MAG: DeoR/GlpR transcriptional regulator [Caldilineales bacterium]|nr:DeoR/GlpR transcriptional regulator [Caldilineales bacterium]